MGLDLSDFPAASPEIVWACTQKTSKYIKGRISAVGGDTHHQASSEFGNVRGLHIARDTGLRHMVTFDLALGEEDGTVVVTEIEPHSHTPATSRTEHTIAYTSPKSCYEDILKLTHEKRPDLDEALAMKLKGLFSAKASSAEDEE